MTAGLKIVDPTAVLSADACMHHRGPLAHPGQLSLTRETLSFSPSRALDRLTGANDLEIPVSSIVEITSGGINHNLDIVTDGDTHRFSGRGALRVHARLTALLAEHDAIDGESALFEPGERVLLQGRGELFVNDLMAVRGEVTLTDRRFRFLPGIGIEKVIWNTTQVDEDLSSIESCSLRGLRRRLHLDMGEETLILGGALTSQLFETLGNLLGLNGGDLEDTGETLATWDVQLRKGPIAHPGVLTFTASHVEFRPTGLFDAMVGVKPFRFQIEDVTRLSIRGWPERKLIVRVGHEVFAFSVADVADRFESLRHLVRDRHYQLAVDEGSLGIPRYQSCLDSWSEKVQYRHGEQIVLGTFVMEQLDEYEVRFGWLLLLRTRLLFLPLGGLGSREQEMELPLDDVCRLDGGPRSRPDQLLMSTEGGSFRYLISDREGVVEDFWSQCRSPTRILVWETLGPRSAARVMGKCKFMRIMTHGDTVVDMSPGMTLEHDAGVAVVLPGEPGSSVPIDTWVTVEVGQSEGIYQLDSKVIRSTITPLEGVVPNPAGTHLLILRTPTELRVYNQRQGYRVTTEFRLRAQTLAQTADGGNWMVTGTPFQGMVVDLSIGGCAMDSDYELTEGERLSVTLPLLDQWVELRATCVRLTPSQNGPGQVRYGLEFRELSMAQEDILHKAVLSMQREALSDDEEEEGAIKDE